MAAKKKGAPAKKTVETVDTSANKDRPDISETLRSIKTKFGDEAIMTLGETKKVNVDAVPTGSFGLDEDLCIGGFPLGLII